MAAAVCWNKYFNNEQGRREGGRRQYLVYLNRVGWYPVFVVWMFDIGPSMQNVFTTLIPLFLTMNNKKIHMIFPLSFINWLLIRLIITGWNQRNSVSIKIRLDVNEWTMQSLFRFNLNWSYIYFCSASADSEANSWSPWWYRLCQDQLWHLLAPPWPQRTWHASPWSSPILFIIFCLKLWSAEKSAEVSIANAGCRTQQISNFR